MKSITYIGGCSTICEFGQKFTLARRTVLLDDESARPFLNNVSYKVVDVPEEKIVPEKNENPSDENPSDENPSDENPSDENPSDEKEEARRKLSSLTNEQLKMMCEDKGLKVSGNKDELVDRLLETL